MRKTIFWNLKINPQEIHFLNSIIESYEGWLTCAPSTPKKDGCNCGSCLIFWKKLKRLSPASLQALAYLKWNGGTLCMPAKEFGAQEIMDFIILEPPSSD